MEPGLREMEMTVTNTLNNRTLASIVEEFFGEDETPRVIFCDAGNGCGFGEEGRAVDYVPAWGSLLMTNITPDCADHETTDGFTATVQSEWQVTGEGSNPYRYRIRF